MQHCYFAKEPPTVEVRGDLLFIIPDGCACEIALTAHTMRRFVLLANEAVAKWQVEHLSGTVTELRPRH